MNEQPTDRRSSTASGSPGAPARRAARGPRRRPTVAPRTIESYIKANSAPRYMRRLREIEVEFQAQRRRLGAAYAALVESLGPDAGLFSQRWREQAQGWRFDRLNELIREHNTWYPVEASLPMDPRTGDYRAVRGASYRRVELGPAWVLEHFPPSLGAATGAPRRAPREPSPRARARARAEPSTVAYSRRLDHSR